MFVYLLVLVECGVLQKVLTNYYWPLPAVLTSRLTH